MFFCSILHYSVVPLKLAGNMLEFLMGLGFYPVFQQTHKSFYSLTSALEEGEQLDTGTARVLVLKYQE